MRKKHKLHNNIHALRAKVHELLSTDGAALARVLGYEVQPFHREWLALQENRRSLLLAPRGHGKSSIAGISFAIWKLVQDPNRRILIVSNTVEQGKVFLREIRAHLEGNPVLRAMYGNLRAGKWSETELLVRRSRIDFDVVIADDIVDEENSWCESQRQKLQTWFYKTLFPCLEPDGEIHIIGTRYHGGDLYGEIIRKQEVAEERRSSNQFDRGETQETVSSWAICRSRALDGDNVLWQQRFPRHILAELRAEMGEILFACQYLNDPSGSDDAIFKEPWLEFYETLPMEPDGNGGYRTVPLRIYQGVDLAISQRSSADYFAVVTIAVDKNHNVYVLDTYRGRLTFDKQMQKVRELAERYQPLRVAIEANAYQDVLPSELIRTSGLPIKRVRQTRDKMVRAIRLSPQFENGKIFLKRSMNELIAELLLFPRGAHDDLFDAFEIAVSESVGGTILEAGQY